MSMEASINHIWVTPCGYIDEIILSNHQTYKSIAELKRATDSNKIKLANAKITPQHTILMDYYNFKTLYIGIQYEAINLNEFKLVKVVYEQLSTVSNQNINLVHTLELETPYINVKNKLERIGFKTVIDGKSNQTYRLSIESIWLKHCIYKEI